LGNVSKWNVLLIDTGARTVYTIEHMSNTHTRTRTAERILYGIGEFTRQHGYSPSVRELAAMIDVKSTNTVAYHLTALEARGDITRQAGIARSIVVTKAAQ
jgi:repressor LexA